MKKRHFVSSRRIILIAFFVASVLSANAQVMWNLKGGWMSRKVNYEEDGGNIEKITRPDWMAGLELEIPLSERLNLETGLRWKLHNVFVNKEYQFEKSFQGEQYSIHKTFEAKQMAEIPLRLTYKQPLGRHFSLHVGVGPYISCLLDGGWSHYENTREVLTTFGEAEWRDAKLKDNIHVGLEPSIAINWACLSLGATYNIPCFYKGYKDENKPVVMATLGIRFKSHVWKYVGATLLTIVSVGTAAGYAWEAANSSSYSSSSYSSGSSYRSSSSSYSRSSSSSSVKSCKFCAGSGRCSGSHRCRGTGKCNYCNGEKVKSTDGHYHECGACHGTGKCSFCSGSGKCKHCGGTGKG